MDYTSNLLEGLEIGAPSARPSVTTELPPWEYAIPTSWSEMMSSKGSFAGNSAVSTYLTCPEKARLQAAGVRKRGTTPDEGDDLKSTGFGTLMHHLLSIRLVHGMEQAVRFIGPLNASEGEMWSYGIGLGMEDRVKAFEMLKTYDATWPVDKEPFRYLAVEAEVISNLSLDPSREVLRSARFDKVVVDNATGGIYSLEHKTSAQAGEFAMLKYMTQFMIQGAIWNKNPYLVARYGRMVGVIPDVLVKTKTPKVERLASRRVHREYERLVCEYMALPEQVKFPVRDDKSYPKMLNACYSGYGACPYVFGCWDGAWGDYEVVESSTAAPAEGSVSTT